MTLSLQHLAVSLPAFSLPFPSSLPFLSPSFLPGWLLSLLRRLRNASRCFLYMTQPLTHTHTHRHTHTQTHTVSLWGHFLSFEHKQPETHYFDFRWKSVSNLCTQIPLLCTDPGTASVFFYFSSLSYGMTSPNWHQISASQQVNHADPFPSLHFRVKHTHRIQWYLCGRAALQCLLFTKLS